MVTSTASAVTSSGESLRVTPASVLVTVIRVKVCRVIAHTPATPVTIVSGHLKTHLQGMDETAAGALDGHHTV